MSNIDADLETWFIKTQINYDSFCNITYFSSPEPMAHSMGLSRRHSVSACVRLPFQNYLHVPLLKAIWPLTIIFIVTGVGEILH